MDDYVIKLYVTGQTPRSLQAIANLRRICEEELAGRYELMVIDVLERPQLAEDDGWWRRCGRSSPPHGGRVEVHSEGVGRGAEFSVYLPEEPADAAETAASTPRTAAASDEEGLQVLLVDDNLDLLRNLSRLLELSGHRVRTASNGLDALRAALNPRPQVVLLDIGLPGMDGYQVAHHLRTEQGLVDALLIAISGYSRAEDRRRSREAGFDFHLSKPVDHATLLSLFRRARTGLPATAPAAGLRERSSGTGTS